jgi:hypothetical protein
LLRRFRDGWASERIAEALHSDAETVRDYRRLYQSAGVGGLERLAYVGAEPGLNGPILLHFEDAVVGRAAEVHQGSGHPAPPSIVRIVPDV